MARVMITETMFRRLVKGEVVTTQGTMVALADIGWDRMRQIIAEVAVEQATEREKEQP